MPRLLTGYSQCSETNTPSGWACQLIITMMGGGVGLSYIGTRSLWINVDQLLILIVSMMSLFLWWFFYHPTLLNSVSCLFWWNLQQTLVISFYPRHPCLIVQQIQKITNLPTSLLVWDSCLVMLRKVCGLLTTTKTNKHADNCGLDLTTGAVSTTVTHAQ